MVRIAKTLTLLFLLILGISEDVRSQSSKVLKQPAHVFPQTLSWWHSIYKYPQFGPGRITFFTDFSPVQELRLNYNFYYGQMDMIDANGDTLQLKPLKTVKSVQVNDDVYYFDEKKGYLHVIVQGDVTLAAHTFFHLAGMEYVSGNITQPGGESSGADLRGAPSIYDKYYVLKSTYYFIDANKKVSIPSKSILLKMFPEYREVIDDYVLTSSINFSTETDLVKVSEFCNRLRHISPDSGQQMIVRANERASLRLRAFTYRFPSFQDGVVVYKDGSQRRYSMGLNYNILTGEMDALDGADTAKIRNSGSIATLNLDGTTYLKKSVGYIEFILNGPVSLGVSRTTYLLHSQSVDAFTKYAPDAAYDPSSARDDVAHFDRIFARQNRYYLIDDRGSVYTPTESAFHQLYPSHKKDVDNYFTSNHPNLRDEEDLKSMVSYLSVLTR